LYETNFEVDSAEYARKSLAVYERLTLLSETSRSFDPSSLDSKIDHLHKLRSSGNSKKGKRVPKPCRSKMAEKFKVYIKEVMDSTGEIITTSRMKRLLMAKFPTEETYPSVPALIYFFKRGLGLTYKKISKVNLQMNSSRNKYRR
jgi:hypothetical protein